MNTLKLRQKGIILVGVPLCFQMIFLVVLVKLSQDADAAMRRESDSKELIYVCSNVLQHLVDCGVYAAMYNYTVDERIRAKCSDSMRIAQNELDAVATKVNNREQKKGIAELQAAVKETNSALSRFLDKTTGDRKSITIFAGNDGLSAERQLFTDLRKKADSVIEDERERCKIFVQRKLEAKSVLTNTIVIGAIADIIIALSAAFYFFTNIASRLEGLIRNTKSIKDREMSMQPVEGNDEIAQLDRAFQQAVLELRESEQLRRQIVSMVSHDLRSPLGSVDAALTLINEGVLGEVSDQVLAVSRTASDDVTRLIRLTNELLDAESLASGRIKLECKMISVCDVFEELVRVMEYPCASYNVELKTSKNDFEFYGDRNRVLQVLCNLTGNAIKASSPGSSVKIEATQKDAATEFKVIDSGMGIPKEEQTRIFEQFTRLQTDDKGKGVGLSICRSLVELHGGQIGITSTAGHGATFWFTLPPRP